MNAVFSFKAAVKVVMLITDFFFPFLVSSKWLLKLFLFDVCTSFSQV